MDTLAGMTRTGVKVAGPASDLVELENDKGLKHLGITFHRRYRQHDALNADVASIEGFLQDPGCVEVVGLAEHVREAGAFIYPTGTVLPLATVLETLAKTGEPGGIKAGLELAYFVAQALEEAAERGEKFDVVTHGDLSPWRIVLKNDGQVRLIGYGLPQIDLLQYNEDKRTQPKEDGYRYAPPERIEGKEEDSSSDLFSLALIAFELMVGEPLYNGVLSEIKQQATKGQGPYRLYAWREKIPEGVIEVLSRALKYDLDARHTDTNEFVWEVRDLIALPHIDGPSLADVVARVRQRLRRRRALQGGATAAMTPEELAEIADELDGPRRRDIKDPSKARPGTEPVEDEPQRWGSVARSGARERSKESPSSSRDRLRDRLKRSGGAGSSRSDLKERLGRSGSSRKSDLKDRLRRSGSPSKKSDLKDRLRRSRSPASEERPEPARGRSRRAPKEEPKKRGSSLLERLRSSKSGRSDEAAPPPEPSGTTVQVSVDGGPARAVAASEGMTVCRVIARALEATGGPPTSLTGTVDGWFRAEQGGESLSGWDLIDASAEDEIALVYVPCKLVPVLVEVEGDEPASFRAPVNSAVRAGAVLDQILTSLELDGEGWQISAGGRVLPPLLAMGEVFRDSPDDVVKLVVKP